MSVKNNYKYIFKLGSESASNNVIYTSSSPFKVTQEEKNVPQSYSQPLQSSQPAEKDKVLGIFKIYYVKLHNFKLKIYHKYSHKYCKHYQH